MGTGAGGENKYITSTTPINQSLIITSLSGATSGTPPSTNTAFLHKLGSGTSWLSLAGPQSGRDAWALHAFKLSTDTTSADGSGTTAQFDIVGIPGGASTAGYSAVGISSSIDGGVTGSLSSAAVYGIAMNVFNGAASGNTLGALYGINMNIGANGAGPVTTAVGVQINRFANDSAVTTNIYGVHIADLAPSSDPAPTSAYGILFDPSQRFATPYVPIRFANAQGPVFRNAANSADIQAPFIDGSNNLNLGIGSPRVIPNGDGALDIGSATNRFGSAYLAGTPIIYGTSPAAIASTLSLSAATGIGNGANTSVQAPALGTGSGPANPLLVTNFIKATIGITTVWIPVMQ